MLYRRHSFEHKQVQTYINLPAQKYCSYWLLSLRTGHYSSQAGLSVDRAFKQERQRAGEREREKLEGRKEDENESSDKNGGRKRKIGEKRQREKGMERKREIEEREPFTA